MDGQIEIVRFSQEDLCPALYSALCMYNPTQSPQLPLEEVRVPATEREKEPQRG